MKTTPALLTATALAGLVAIQPAVANPIAMELGPFNSARIGTAIEARIVVGGTQSVAVEVKDPATLRDLRLDVVDGELRAWIEEDFWDILSFRDNAVRLTVTVPSLDAIAANSAADIEVVGVTGEDFAIKADSASIIRLSGVDVASIRLDADSAARLVLSGTCGKAIVRAQSAAQVDAVDLACADIDVRAESAANARISADGNVKVAASSAGRVELLGMPTGLDVDVNSGGDLDIVQ